MPLMILLLLFLFSVVLSPYSLLFVPSHPRLENFLVLLKKNLPSFDQT